MVELKRSRSLGRYLDALSQMFVDLGSCADEMDRMIESNCLALFSVINYLIVGIVIVEQVQICLVSHSLSVF